MTQTNNPTAPTHNLCVKRKNAERSVFVQVGAGWCNDRGQIRLVLNPGVSLSWKDEKELSVTLFPNNTDNGNTTFHTRG